MTRQEEILEALKASPGIRSATERFYDAAFADGWAMGLRVALQEIEGLNAWDLPPIQRERVQVILRRLLEGREARA